MSPSVITMTKDKEFSLPKWDLKEMKWSEFYSKVMTALHKYKMESLLGASATVTENCALSSKLCYKLYEKLHGLALAPFNLIDAQSYNLQGGRGVEMLQALKYKFNSLIFERICALQEKLQKLVLEPHQDLDDFVNELHDINTMLNKANPPQGYSELQLVNMVLHQLQASCYSDQIKAIMTAYHIDSSAITSLCGHVLFTILKNILFKIVYSWQITKLRNYTRNLIHWITSLVLGLE